MDNWQAVQNWLVFVPIVGGLAWYYLPRSQPSTASKQDLFSIPAARRKPERDIKQKPQKKVGFTQPVKENVASSAQSGREQAKKRKVEQTPQQASVVPAQAQNEPDDDLDMSTRQFAQQMQKARQGQQLSSSKSNEKRVKTVKQGSALDRPVLSSTPLPTGADVEQTSSSPSFVAGDVSDMLEPATSGPKSMRITPASQPQRERAAKSAKKEEVETKKQRQNRIKVEERKLQREDEEKERKALEEKQRRAAREARGEPAKNGISVPKAPTSNAWDAKPRAQEYAPDSSHVAPLLDTFDAESSSSSTGGQGVSTGPSSVDHDIVSEEEQLAHAMQQSVDESGWTTVAMPKKQQKKKAGETSDDPITPTVISTPKKVTAPVKSAIKPTGFQALEDQYTQRTDVDPNDASNWDA